MSSQLADLSGVTLKVVLFLRAINRISSLDNEPRIKLHVFARHWLIFIFTNPRMRQIQSTRYGMDAKKHQVLRPCWKLASITYISHKSHQELGMVPFP